HLDDDLLFGLIYEGPLQEKPWQGFLPYLREIMDAQAVSLMLRPPAAGDKGVILNCRRSDERCQQNVLADTNEWETITYREQFFAIDPFVNLPSGKAVTQQELVPDSELLASAYYRDYLEPIGLFHILGIDIVETDGLIAKLRIARRRCEDAFDDVHKALCEHFLPHLRRAIRIHIRLNRAESERDLYAGAVDQLAVATIILDGKGRVLSTNGMAAEMLRSKDGIAIDKRQQLQVSDRAVKDQLRQMVAVAISAQMSGETSMAHALRVSRPSGLPDLGLVVRPVPRSEWSEGQGHPTVAIFISDPQRQENTSRRMLEELFKLTPAEANLAIKLARGLSIAGVSAEQNISRHTSRAQLKSIFAKTGVTRQAELVRMVLKSVATLG
ncbi:MAG: helix-turn-helix transcriptional regulator, partial [Pseudomonadales bacterium]